MTAPKVYLAGPGVFRPNAKEIGEYLKQVCASHGLEGLWPLDNDISDEKLNLFGQAKAIYLGNRKMIEGCDAVVADISPFRGPHMDCGTAWEIGAAVALNKPVFAYSSDMGDLVLRMTRAAEGGVFRDSEGNQIEHFGLPENLMIACSVNTIDATAMEAIGRASLHLGTFPE